MQTWKLSKVNEERTPSSIYLSGESAERVSVEEALRRLAEFESLLADIASRFDSSPHEEIEDVIADSQRRICHHLDIDCSILWLASEDDPDKMVPKHIYQAPDGQQPLDTPDSFPWSLENLLNGETLIIKSVQGVEADEVWKVKRGGLPGAPSAVVIPLLRGKDLSGVLAFGMTPKDRNCTDITVQGLKIAAHIFDNALQRVHTGHLLKQRLKEIGESKRVPKPRKIDSGEHFQLHPAHDIVGQSTVIKTALMQAGKVAPTDSTVLVVGETGTGKELLARAIHRMSLRSSRPLVTINCASLPPTLIESELFGRERGAYTGAMTKMIGRFESADCGTLFLDEVGELPLELQNKFLRVLEYGVFERLGSTRSMKVNIRLIAATNRDLADDIGDGRFRKDLYYRLNVFPILIPPLRERADDIPLLVWAFVNDFQQRMGKRIESISKKGMRALQEYPWPGNVRELRNVVERAMILASNEHLEITVPGIARPDKTADDEPHDLMGNQKLECAERRHILRVLEEVRWRVTGRGSAAEVLGLKRSTLQSKMKKLGIKRPIP